MMVLPKKSSTVWKRFFEENKTLVYSYVVRQIRNGINNNLDRVELFSFEGNNTPSVVTKNNYIDTLEEILKYFITAEEYEHAETTNTLIKTYYINKLIQETIPGD